MLRAGQLDNAVWRKSSYSSDQGECVEVAFGADAVGVRDSKNPSGGVLILPASSWRGFRTGGYPRPVG